MARPQSAGINVSTALFRGLLVGILVAVTLAVGTRDVWAGHGSDCGATQEGTVAEPGKTNQKYGVDGWIRVIDPVPNPSYGIVKSIYIWEDAPNETFVELGWKWIDPPTPLMPNEEYDILPNAFVV